MKRFRIVLVAVALAAAVSAPTPSALGQAASGCILAAAGEGWALLSADQDRPFAEAPLPVDAAVPHVQTEVTNETAIARGFLADPGLVARGQVEAARPIPPPSEGPPVYTVPQPVFPAAAYATQPGGAPESSFGVGGAVDPTGQIYIGAARVQSTAAQGPPSATSVATIGNLAFVPGPNGAALAPPPDAADGAGVRGLVTVGGALTRSAAGLNAQTGRVRGFASSSLSEVEIAGVVRIRSMEVVAEALTGGGEPSRRATTRVDGLSIAGSEVPFDEQGLAAANAALAPAGIQLIPANEAPASTSDSQEAIVGGLIVRGENVDSSGERRRVNLVLGYAKASSKCLPIDADNGLLDTLADTTLVEGEAFGPPPADSGLPSDLLAAGDVGTGSTPSISLGGRGTPRYVLRWNWDHFKIKFWKAGDIFTALGSFGLFLVALALAWQRRRLARALNR